MYIRPKTLRRLLVLFLGLLLVVGAGALVYFTRQRSDAAEVAQLRTQAMATYKTSDYAKAVTELGEYIHKAKAQDTDPEALFAYGKSRISVEMPRSRHLFEGVQIFQHYLEVKPGDDKAQHILLDLYAKLQYNTEAVRLADELLARNPRDTEAMKSKVIALNNQRKFDDALTISRRINELAPRDLVSQVVTLELLDQLQTPPAGLIAHAQALRQAHPDDPRFEVLMAYAHLLAKQDAEAGKWMQSAADRKPPDAQFVAELSRLLNAKGLYEASGTLVRRAADVLADPAVQRALAQRLLQDRKLDELIDRWKNLNPKSPESDGRVLGYRALALYETGRAAEAKAVVDALSHRSSDGPAAAWAIALSARYATPSLVPTDVVSRVREAWSRDSDNPALCMLLAEAHEATGETELALQQAAQAAQMAPSWAAPYLLMSRALIATGRQADAVVAANEAIRRAPGHYEAETQLARALFAKTADAGPAADYTELLRVLQDIQKTWQDSDTLPIYVTVLARMGERDKAIELVKSAIAADPPLPSLALLRLASVCDAEKLDLGQAVRDQLQKSQGLTVEVALAQALALFDAKRPQDGLKVLLDAQKGHESELAWRLALAEYREHSQDAQALAEWVALGDQFPADLHVQELALKAPSRTHDRSFWMRTIDRVKSLTGEQGMLWKIERGRWLLSGDLSEKDKADAVNLLTEVTHAAPGLAEPHRLLAIALEKVNNSASAIRELTAAADLVPEDAAITQDLVSLLLANNKNSDAIAYLDRLARSPKLSAAAKLWLARTYAEQGYNEKAIAMIDEDSAGGSTPQRDAVLAGLYRRTGRIDQAAVLYKTLLDKSIPDATVWGDGADFFASQNDFATAEQFLAKLKDVPLSPGGAELIRAQFAERWKGDAEALKDYQAATKAAPASENTWGSLAGFHLRRLQFAEAASAAGEGLKTVPASSRLKAIGDESSRLSALGSPRDLQPLADALSRNPLDPAAGEMLQVLSSAHAAKLSLDATTEKLREVADKNPSFLPLQTQVVRNYISAGQYDKAIEIARRAAQSSPNDPEPQRLLTGIYFTSGEWSKAAEAAQLWRQRSPDQPMPADLMLAQIYLRQPHKDGPAAVSLLEPYAKADLPAEKKELPLRLYARALMLSNRTPEAAELLKPMLAGSPGWRIAWLELTDAGHKDADAATAWVVQVAPVISKDSVEEQYALARAWCLVGTQFDSPKALDSARDVLKPLIAKTDAKPQVWLLAAIAAQAQGDYPAAEDAFRHVLRANPQSADSQNDLAYVLWLKGRAEDLPEARKLAESAVAAQPSNASFYDTLARIQAKSGDRKSAIASFRAALEKDPNSLEAMIGMADLLLQEPGKRDEAKDLVAQIKRLMEASPPLSAVLRQQYKTVRDAVAGSF